MPVKKKKNPRVFLYIFIALILIVTLAPFYWIINMSITGYALARLRFKWGIFPVVLALIFQKYLVGGLTAGGVKG